MLTTLHHAEGEDEEAVTTLLELLHADSSHTQRRQLFSNGVMPALLGILRSSDHVGLLTKVVACVSLMARGSDETRALLAETDVVSLLLGLCLGHNCPQAMEPQVAFCAAYTKAPSSDSPPSPPCRPPAGAWSGCLCMSRCWQR